MSTPSTPSTPSATEAIGPFAKLGTVIASAAAVVATTFALFDSVLADLMPKVDGAKQAVDFVSLGTVVVLLSLTMFIRKRLSVMSQMLWAGAALVLLVAAVLVFLSFKDLVRERVYYYPPDTAAGAPQEPYIGAPLHALGQTRVRDMDIATAVSHLGGPAFVTGHQLLWSTEDEHRVEGRFLRYYVVLAFLMTTALFVAAIAVWRTLGAEKAARRPAPSAPPKDA
jgi:hypothetical protein